MALTQDLFGHSFSASAIREINAKLDESLAQFAGRRLDEACPYLIVDARYERVREAGMTRSQAVLLAIGIDWDGRRSILAVETRMRRSDHHDPPARRAGLVDGRSTRRVRRPPHRPDHKAAHGRCTGGRAF